MNPNMPSTSGNAVVPFVTGQGTTINFLGNSSVYINVLNRPGTYTLNMGFQQGQGSTAAPVQNRGLSYHVTTGQRPPETPARPIEGSPPPVVSPWASGQMSGLDVTNGGSFVSNPASPGGWPNQ